MDESLDFGLDVDDVRKIQSVFAKRSGIENVIIYGSRAKGNYQQSSDIDLTIVGHLTTQQFLQIENELDDLMLPYKIDLSLFHDIENPKLIDHIRRVGKAFFKD